MNAQLLQPQFPQYAPVSIQPAPPAHAAGFSQSEGILAYWLVYDLLALFWVVWAVRAFYRRRKPSTAPVKRTLMAVCFFFGDSLGPAAWLGYGLLCLLVLRDLRQMFIAIRA